SKLSIWPSVEADQVYGSESDLWGETWSSTDINATTFGAAMSVKWVADGVSYTDRMTLEVCYTNPTATPTPPASQTPTPTDTQTPADTSTATPTVTPMLSTNSLTETPTNTPTRTATPTPLCAATPVSECRTAEKSVLLLNIKPV